MLRNSKIWNTSCHKISQNKESNGPDNVPTELLQMIHEDHISALIKFFNDMYTTGEIPEEWLRSFEEAGKEVRRIQVN